MEPLQTEAIILAAGYSSRAHDFKMTLKLGELTVLEHTLSKFDGICSKIIIIGGYQWEKVRKVAFEIQKSNKYSMEITAVFNEHFDKGMFSSIQRGCMEINTPAFFITPGDCPIVNKNTIQKLAAQQGAVVIPSYHYKGGHPIKLTKEVKMKIIQAEESCNLRQILAAYERCYVNVEDPGVLMDIDTPEDYRTAIKYYEGLMNETDYPHKTRNTE